MRGTYKALILSTLVVLVAACGGAQPEPLTDAGATHAASCESLRAALTGETRLTAAEAASWQAEVARLEGLVASGAAYGVDVPAARHALAEAWYRLETDAYLAEVETFCAVDAAHRCSPAEVLPVARYEHTIATLESLVTQYPDYEQMDLVLKELVVALHREGRVHHAEYYARGLQLHFPESPYVATGDASWPTSNPPRI